MDKNNKTQNTKNNKKSDDKFQSKRIKHNPQDESAKTAFRLNNNDDLI